jgi:diadenosine tetraphosphate (Ap4A) HIT family hydrolase
VYAAGVECYSCEQESRFDVLPARERIAADEHWRVAHVFGGALPGWLVLLPRRHVTAIADLTDAEAADLGRWQVELSRALRVVTGCAKTYVAQFAEAEGFRHVHFHVVPRMPDLPQQLRGPEVFQLLAVAEPISDDQADRLAIALSEHLSSTKSSTVDDRQGSVS